MRTSAYLNKTREPGLINNVFQLNLTLMLTLMNVLGNKPTSISLKIIHGYLAPQDFPARLQFAG